MNIFNPFSFRGCVLALALAAWTLSPHVSATADDRQVLRERLEFWYVADGTTTPRPAPEVLDNEGVSQGTESGAFWSNSGIGGLHGLVRSLLRAPGSGGDEQLQHYVRRTIDITPGSGKVRIVMFDDVSQPMTPAATVRANWGGCPQPNGTMWPCATHYDPGNAHTGAMWLGAQYFATTNRSKLGTFLHELIHTQDRTDGRPHLFTVGSTNYRYGADGSHYGVELIPNRAMTYKEGIANAIRLMYDQAASGRYMDLVANNDFLWVERAAPPAGSGIHPDAWLHAQLTAAGISPDTVPESLRSRLRADLVNNYDAYRIHNLPPRFVVHNEYILALIISTYTEYVDAVRFFNGLRSTNDALFMASGSGLAVLFETLCTAGLPDGTTLTDVSRASYAGQQSHMLPLAYADYFTGFRTSSKAEFQTLFENLLPQGWIDLYWDIHRPTARAAVTAPSASHAASRNDLTSLAMALGLNQSQPD
jgi:hypothetical protein